MVPNLNPATPFNPMGDFAHISQVATIDFSISTASTAPYKSAADFVAAAKAAPGKLTYASGGNGSPQHMAGALFAAHTGIDIRHVPYRGASQAAQDVASGQCDVTLQGIATVAALAKAGKLRLIGVMTDQRHPEFPDAPTLKEVGITGFDFSTWFALVAPKGTPREIVERLQRESVKALGDAEIKERYAALGLRPRHHAREDDGHRAGAAHALRQGDPRQQHQGRLIAIPGMRIAPPARKLKRLSCGTEPPLRAAINAL